MAGALTGEQCWLVRQGGRFAPGSGLMATLHFCGWRLRGAGGLHHACLHTYWVMGGADGGCAHAVVNTVQPTHIHPAESSCRVSRSRACRLQERVRPLGRPCVSAHDAVRPRVGGEGA